MSRPEARPRRGPEDDAAARFELPRAVAHASDPLGELGP